jgi:hypothetical protein
MPRVHRSRAFVATLPILLRLSGVLAGVSACLEGQFVGNHPGPGAVLPPHDGPLVDVGVEQPRGVPDAAEAGPNRPIDTRPDAARDEAAPADRPSVEALLDCGPSGLALEAHGPVANRVNYVVLGDGYLTSELDTTYLAHVRSMIAALFSDRHEPYRRYRRFLNICVLKVASNESGVDGDGQVRDTAFDGRGDDRSRLGTVNGTKVRAAITRLLPHTMDVDWRSVVLNSDQWWHSGGAIMVWSGGGGSRAAGAAVHESGHSFHRLADEYDHGSCQTAGEPTEINVTADPTGQRKWKEWLDFDQVPGTGLQRPVQGGRYCRTGIYRPSVNSLMRAVPGAFNAISREKIVRDIYNIVSPIDRATDPRAIASPPELTVQVVDPTVIKVEWSVDGQMVSADGGESFRPTGLAPGIHTVSARAYDDTPWVRGDRSRLQRTVQWTITIP